MFITLKKANQRLDAIIDQLDGIHFEQLFLGLLDYDEKVHFVLFMNGFGSYQHFKDAVRWSLFKNDWRLDFLHPTKFPDLEFMQKRFEEWKKGFYSRYLMRQILKKTTIPEELGLEESLKDQSLNEDNQITMLININYNNVLKEPTVIPPHSSFFYFIHNAHDKATDYFSPENAQLKAFLEEGAAHSVVANKNMNLNMSCGSYLVDKDPEQMYSIHKMLTYKNNSTYFFNPKSESGFKNAEKTIEESIQKQWNAKSNESKIVINKLKEPNEIDFLGTNITLDSRYRTFNNIFFVNLKGVEYLFNDDNANIELWINIVRMIRKYKSFVVFNMNDEEVQRHKNERFMEVLIENSNIGINF